MKQMKKIPIPLLSYLIVMTVLGCSFLVRELINGKWSVLLIACGLYTLTLLAILHGKQPK